MTGNDASSASLEHAALHNAGGGPAWRTLGAAGHQASSMVRAILAFCTPGRIAVVLALVTLPSLLKTPIQIGALAILLVAAVGSVVTGRLRRRRRIRPRVVLRAVFPRRIFAGPSMRADILMTFLNSFVVGGLIGWAILSAHAIAHFVFAHLSSNFGAPQMGWSNPVAARVVLTLALFIAAEFAYYVDHYLSHVVPFLWEFHRVHHTAESLTPLTVFRVHPIDSLVFYNISGVFIGVTQGILAYWLGYAGPEYLAFGINVLSMLFLLVVANLLHSHVWIPFRGLPGKLLISPAHHQLHHSLDSAHHGRNLGNALAVFDWMFGTLLIPQARREPLAFGVPPGRENPHSISGLLIAPCLVGWRHLRGDAALGDFRRLARHLPNLGILAVMARAEE